MSVYTNPPEWEAQGKKPPSSKRTEGWKPGDRVPASWLNWFWFSTVNSLREIAQAFVSHVDDKNNPHGVTKAQVGLGNVENYGIATQAEAEAGSVNNKYMTPLRVKQAVDASGTSAATANTLVRRDSAGRAKVADPQEPDDIVTKKYVDDRVGTAIVVLTGTISHGGTLPIPSGFTEQQCKFFVSINTLITTNTSIRDSRFGARLIGRQVWCRWENTDGSRATNGTANYMVIGVK